MRGAILVGGLELQHDLAYAIAFKPLVSNRRAGDVAAQLLEFVALIGGTTH